MRGTPKGYTWSGTLVKGTVVIGTPGEEHLCEGYTYERYTWRGSPEAVQL